MSAWMFRSGLESLFHSLRCHGQLQEADPHGVVNGVGDEGTHEHDGRFAPALRGQVRAFLQAGRPLASRPLLAVLAVVIGAGALAVQLEAFRWAPVGFIEVVKRGTGMASAVLVGRFVFGEPLNGRKVMAVVLLTLGVALVVGLR